MRRLFMAGMCITVSMVLVSCGSKGLDLDRLRESEIAQVKTIIAKLEPLIIERKKAMALATLTFDELYAPLTKDEQSFLQLFEHLDPKKLKVRIPFRGIATGKEELHVITGQIITMKGKRIELPPQFLPPHVYQAYRTMMDHMMRDIGKKLYIESGYRSSAYQLYLFVYYLQNHEYSIRETVKFNALVGFSEHGSVEHQAIDFINEDGINGEEDIPQFEALPEYQWLLKHARAYGFVLSYPKDAPTGITYEPWHWRYEGKKAKG